MPSLRTRLESNSALLGLGLLLCAQFIVAKVLPREPYPALLFPGGSSTSRRDGDEPLEGYRIYALLHSGEVRLVDHHQLLSQVPKHFRRRILARLLDTDFQMVDAEGQAWFRDRLRQLAFEDARGIVVRRVLLGRDRTPEPLAEATMAWLPAYPEGPVTALDFAGNSGAMDGPGEF